MIQYTTDERTTIIILNCSIDGTEKFEALGEVPMLFYNFRLTHKCACWNRCIGKFIKKKNIIFDSHSYRCNTKRYYYY